MINADSSERCEGCGADITSIKPSVNQGGVSMFGAQSFMRGPKLNASSEDPVTSKRDVEISIPLLKSHNEKAIIELVHTASSKDATIPVQPTFYCSLSEHDLMSAMRI